MPTTLYSWLDKTMLGLSSSISCLHIQGGATTCGRVRVSEPRTVPLAVVPLIKKAPLELIYPRVRLIAPDIPDGADPLGRIVPVWRADPDGVSSDNREHSLSYSGLRFSANPKSQLARRRSQVMASSSRLALPAVHRCCWSPSLAAMAASAASAAKCSAALCRLDMPLRMG